MLARPRARWAFAALLAAAPACGGGEEEPPPGESWVELGTGTTAFEALAADSELVLVAGPQGGHHFVVHARMGGLLPGDPTMPGLIGNPSTLFTVEDEQGVRLDVDMAPYRLGYEPAPDGGDGYVLTSGRILQVQEERVVAMYGARVKIKVEVTDVREATASDERWVIAIEDDLAPRADGGPDTGGGGEGGGPDTGGGEGGPDRGDADAGPGGGR